MLLLNLDEKSREPKYHQVLEGIRSRIEDRTLLPGERLPSTRRLAETLGVHRSTIALAYQELWSLDFLDLRPGARARVRERLQIVTTVDRTAKSLIEWQATASKASESALNSHRLVSPVTKGDESLPAISFRSLDMDHRLFPLENFRSCLTRITKKHGAALLGYGDHAGFLPLRESIARRLQCHSISVTADEIMITSGAQQAIDLVLRMLASPGRAVAIESLTYSHMLPLLRLSGLQPIEIPIRSDGMDLEYLERMIGKEKPALIYTMPTFHNPTGVSTDQAHRERLLSICERHRIPILEDAFEEEMKYFGKVVLPIKSMDSRRIVIYCGTFSKVLFPGVRIGWIAAERECIERLVAIRCFSDLAPNTILQAAMDEFCRNGYYDRHINRMHRIYRRRMQTAVRALREFISPEWAEWTDPSGGYLIWLKLKPVSTPAPDWKSLFAAHGVQVAHGRQFFFSDPGDTYFRLSISTLDEEEIVEVLRRLSRALDHAYAKNQY